MQARQIMTSPVVTVRSGTTVREAATLLLEQRITAAPVLDAGGELIGIVSEGVAQTMLGSDVRSIPIVEGATVIGIVSRRDLLRTLVRDDDAIRADIIDRITDCCDPDRSWDVQVTDGAVIIIVGELDDDGRATIALARTVPGVGSVHLASHRTPARS